MEKFPTVAACDIMKIDRQRLNEDIASGAYPCAPPAHGRVGRWWDENDLCALRVYTFWGGIYRTDAGIKKSALHKSVAGMYARETLSALRSDLDGANRIDLPLNGFNDDWVARKMDDAPAFFVPVGGEMVGSDIATICISLDGIREQVRQLIKAWKGEEKHESNTSGDD